jgi:hypothetical protein
MATTLKVAGELRPVRGDVEATVGHGDLRRRVSID